MFLLRLFEIPVTVLALRFLCIRIQYSYMYMYIHNIVLHVVILCRHSTHSPIDLLLPVQSLHVVLPRYRFIVTFPHIIYICIYNSLHHSCLCQNSHLGNSAPTTTLAILNTQLKHYSVAFDARAGKLHSDNVRLIAGMKGEAPSITVAMLVSQLKHFSVDGRG